MRRWNRIVWAWLLYYLQVSVVGSDRVSSPWNMETLRNSPEASWVFDVTNHVYRVLYESVPYQGHSTRVFAYCAIPTNAAAPYPAMVLVHGAGQHAYADWTLHWAARGYFALSMDLTGEGPEGRMVDGGPSYYSGALFEDFDDRTVGETWIYHAVAAVVRGVSLVRNRTDVDPARIGIHGVSMGGVITSTVAGIDDRICTAIPVYGAGFLSQNCTPLNALLVWLPCERRDRWCKVFDPSVYLPHTSAAMLFVGGATDTYFYPPGFQLSQQAVPTPVAVSLRPGMDHGAVWYMPAYEQEIQRFADAKLRGGPPLATLSPSSREANTVSARFISQVPLQTATLFYTTNTGPWKDRVWQSQEAAIHSDKVTAELPSLRPLIYYLGITDEQGAFVSNPLVQADGEVTPQLRFTEIMHLPEIGLQLHGGKPWGHQVKLQMSATTDTCGWRDVVTNRDVGETWVIDIPLVSGSAAALFRLIDLDW